MWGCRCGFTFLAGGGCTANTTPATTSSNAHTPAKMLFFICSSSLLLLARAVVGRLSLHLARTGSTFVACHPGEAVVCHDRTLPPVRSRLERTLVSALWGAAGAGRERRRLRPLRHRLRVCAQRPARPALAAFAAPAARADPPGAGATARHGVGGPGAAAS